jgi:hypothetical protein
VITLLATARFFDPADALADGTRSGLFLLGDPDAADPVYSCLIDTAEGEDLEPGAAGRVLVRLPMLTSYTVCDPAPLWRGAIIGELTRISVLPAAEGDLDQTGAAPNAHRGEREPIDHVSMSTLGR